MALLSPINRAPLTIHGCIRAHTCGSTWLVLFSKCAHLHCYWVGLCTGRKIRENDKNWGNYDLLMSIFKQISSLQTKNIYFEERSERSYDGCHLLPLRLRWCATVSIKPSRATWRTVTTCSWIEGGYTVKEFVSECWRELRSHMVERIYLYCAALKNDSPPPIYSAIYLLKEQIYFMQIKHWHHAYQFITDCQSKP